MTEQTSPTNSRGPRGTGFPQMALDDAVAVIKAAGSYGRSHTDAAFAGYLGHETTNSGPFRKKMAALRDWGLIERPKGGQVPLTDLGQQIAHPTGDERQLLQQAFFSAKPFKTIYEESAKGTDLSLELIGNRAITTLGVSAPSKARFSESFRRSVIAAGLGRDGANGSIQLIPPGSEPETTGSDVEDGASDESRAAPPTGPQVPITQTSGAHAQPPTVAGRPPIIHQEWPVAGGRVLFEVVLDGPLPGSAFSEVATVMTAVESFVGSLEPAAPAPAAEFEPAHADASD